MTISNIKLRLARLQRACSERGYKLNIQIPLPLTGQWGSVSTFIELPDESIIAITIRKKTLGKPPTVWLFDDKTHQGDDEELMVFLADLYTLFDPPDNVLPFKKP